MFRFVAILSLLDIRYDIQINLNEVAPNLFQLKRMLYTLSIWQ